MSLLTPEELAKLEGAESLIISLDEIIQRAGTQEMQEIVMGMAHRGRLNVLVNIMGKSPAELFSELEGKHGWKQDVTGDVKLPAGVEMVMPGDNISCEITLITPVALEKGLRFAIREGGHTVGAGAVAEIIE